MWTGAGVCVVISKVNVVSAAFVLILFALPFSAVSCNGHQVAQATGYQIAMGTDSNQVLTAEGRGIAGSEYQSTSEPGSWPAQAALFFVVLGGLIGFSSLRMRAVISALCFAAAAALLVYLQSAVQSHYENNAAAAVFELHFLPSYWATLILCAAVALANLIAIVRPRERVISGTP
jgi:hypothetical protein